MEILNIDIVGVLLPALLYIAGIVLLIVLIILAIKLINVVDKVDRIALNVEEKVNSLNDFFRIINRVNDGATMVADKVISATTSIVNKIFKKKEKEEKEDE